MNRTVSFALSESSMRTHTWQRFQSGISTLLRMEEQEESQEVTIPTQRQNSSSEQGLARSPQPTDPSSEQPYFSVTPRDIVRIPIPDSSEYIEGQLGVVIQLGFTPMRMTRTPDEQWLVDQYREQLNQAAERMTRELKSRFLEELRNPTPHQVAARTQARRINADAELVQELRDELIIGTADSPLQQFVSRAQHAVTENRGLTTPSENSTLNVETNSDEQPAQTSNSSGEPARERTT